MYYVLGIITKSRIYKKSLYLCYHIARNNTPNLQAVIILFRKFHREEHAGNRESDFPIPERDMVVLKRGLLIRTDLHQLIWHFLK